MLEPVAALRSFRAALRARRHTRGLATLDWAERRSGCALCGGRIATGPPPPILPDELVAEWEIDAHERRLYDEREGSACLDCGATGRSRALALAFVIATGQPRGTRFPDALRSWRGGVLAEINQAKDLHAWLEKVPELRYSEYGSVDPAVPSEDLERLSYADASIRCLFCSDTLEHVPGFDAALAELHRVLEPGGSALITVPLLWHRRTRTRAARVGGALEHRLPASYHGSRRLADRTQGHFVFRELGYDVASTFASRFRTGVVFLDLWRNPYQCAFVLTKP